MRVRIGGFLGVLAVLFLAAAACGSSSSPSGGTSPAMPDGTGSCRAMAGAGGTIQPNTVSSRPQAAAGGTIASGDYVLTDITYYDGSAQGAQTVKKLHFSLGYEAFADGDATMVTENIGRSYTTSGVNITFHEVCHTPAYKFKSTNTYTVPYTATPTQYVEFDTFVSAVFTYTKQ